jgi:copper chaperone NosL
MKTPLIAVFVLVMIGCKASSFHWPPEPAEIHLGEDTCSACKMIISEERFGAQLHVRNEAVLIYDDYGCLLKSTNATSSGDAVVYVRSFEDGSWLKVEQAIFVISKEISSPMGYGIAAFAARKSAEEFAGRLKISKIYDGSDPVTPRELALQMKE